MYCLINVFFIANDKYVFIVEVGHGFCENGPVEYKKIVKGVALIEDLTLNKRPMPFLHWILGNLGPTVKTQVDIFT